MRLVRMSGAKSKVTISALMYATWRRMGILQELHLGIVLEDVAFHVLEQLVQLLAVGSRGLNDDRVRHMLDDELPNLDSVLSLHHPVHLSVGACHP